MITLRSLSSKSTDSDGDSGISTGSSTTTILGDNRPTDYEYALISQHVYGSGRNKPIEGAYFYTGENKTKWKILRARKTACGYFGATYVCYETKQVVVAHRGTNSIKDVVEDIRGIFFNQYTPQKEQALIVVEEAIAWIQTQIDNFHLSFTGHSLGAFLAEISVYHAIHWYESLHVNAVTFESPGSSESIEALEYFNQNKSVLITKLDIVSYVCYPNLINVCNQHVGTVYSINVDLGTFGWWPGLHLLKCHSIDGILDWFKKAVVDKNQSCRRFYMSDWPIGPWQRNVFFKYADFDNGQYDLKRNLRRGSSIKSEIEEVAEISKIKKFLHDQKKKFELRFKGNFKVNNSLSSYNVMPLHHFTPSMQDFLREFDTMVQKLLENNKNHTTEVMELLLKKWRRMKVPESIIDNLKTLKVEKNKISVEEIQIREGANVAEFRREFSNWLEDSEYGTDDLVPSHLMEFDVITTHKEYEILTGKLDSYSRKYSADY